jgi:diaminohydroxyphosphoribosylaminopyrimidine deaminase/5-amino-6-(5-phosphoribosylamino)uracil reductase
VDAVVVGVGTVLADDPALTVRHVGLQDAAQQPIRVVLDSDGRTPATAQVRDGSAPTWILTTEDVPRHDVDAVLALLYERGVRSVLLEGGPTLAGAFLDAGRIDEIIGYVAPALLGQGKPALAARDTGSSIDRAARLHLIDVTPLDGDLRLTARPVVEGV